MPLIITSPPSFPTWVLIWAVLCPLAGLAYTVWHDVLRPKLAEKFDWPEVTEDKLIPPIAWLGMFAFLVVFGGWFFLLDGAGF